MATLLRLFGTILIALSVVDIFLTVLYARSGAGLVAPVLSQGLWRLCRLLARPLGKGGALLLSFAGPVILILIAAAWVFLLVLGFGLVYWPELSIGLQKSLGATPTGFLTALYYSGFCLTTLGIGDLAPASDGIRLLTVLEAALGFSFFTLTITYFLSVYSALQRRNTLASILQHQTSGTGDARAYTTSFGAGGAIIAASRDFSDLASRTADLVEAHSFYPVLHYFHFRRPRYGIPRMAFLLLDTASLAQTLPIAGREGYQAAAVQMAGATRDLLERISEVFLTRRRLEGYEAGAVEIEGWRTHFQEAVQSLKAAGADPGGGPGADEERYLALRRGWHPYIAALADFMGYELTRIIPPKQRP